VTDRVGTVLFDLDGTLSNSAPGILESLRHAFAVVGVAPMTPQQEMHVLGPPFYSSLPEIVAPDLVGDIITAYRGFYSDGGMFDVSPYPGIDGLLAWLAGLGVTMAVATSKPEYYAGPIVEHLGLHEHFATICGDTLDGLRDSKALVVGEALRRLGHPDPSTVVMVGDRMHDVHGAAEHGVRCYGAGWGYGAPGELAGAGAVAVYANADELRLGLVDVVGDISG
jgi:phosphoglycolate phosphatase